MTFGFKGRLCLTFLPAVVVVYGWSSIIWYWGSARMLLDLLWVPAASLVALLWLRDVWAKAPVSDRGSQPG